MLKPHLFPYIQLNPYKKCHLVNWTSQRKWIECQAVNQNNWRAGNMNSSSPEREREKKKWAELTRTSTKTIEWACQVWMKYAKCKYCGGIFKLLRHSEFEMAHQHRNTCITLEFIPQIDPTHTRTQGCDASFFSASKWKVLCSVCIYVYSNIHSSWQRQKKTKHKIRLNGFSCWKWSKLRNMWLLHRWKQFLTVRNCVCVCIVSECQKNESAFLERHFQRLPSKKKREQIVLYYKWFINKQNRVTK